MPRSNRSRRWIASGLAAVVGLLGLGMLSPVAATAEGSYGGPPDANAAGPETEATIVDMIDRSGLYGGTVPSATAQTPYPTTGLIDQRTVETAMIVLDDPGVPHDILAYCIDLGTQTLVGIHYELGTWTDANVPNLPYVQWILDNYYPNVPSIPAGTAAEKVRAVQGAIWYFTDQFVVNRFYPTERNAVRAIVEAAQAALGGGPVPPAPPLPTLTITPASIEGAIDGDLVGPYTVGGDVASAEVEITGTSVYRDALGTIPVADGDTVVPGDELWAEYDAQTAGQGFTLTAIATVVAGNVYLYDGNNPPRVTAQKLVLAATTDVPIRAAATIVHPDTGTFQVDVVLAGAAAGEQDEVELTATCVNAQLPSPIVATRFVPAGSPAGTYSFSFPFIPYFAGDASACDVVQVADGSSANVQVVTSIVPALVTIDSPATQTITVTDTYTIVPGDFQVDIDVVGAAAGLQGQIDLLASCDTGSGAVSQTFLVAAGTSGLSTAGTISAVPSGSVCSVSVTASGDDPDAELVSSVVTPLLSVVPPAGTATAVVENTYDTPSPVTGSFAVDVTIAGAAGGLQGAISVLATCDSGLSAPFTLPAGAATGTHRVATIGGVPVDAVCSVAQTVDGSNADAELAGTSILPASIVISDTVVEVITVTDTYAVPTPPAGSFRVAVTIGGAAAGLQAAITVEARCGDGSVVIVEPFTLTAGLAAGTYDVGTIPEIPVGDECTAVLTADGADADALLSSSSVTPASVIIADGIEASVTVANVYAAAPVPTPTPTPGPIPVTGPAEAGPLSWLGLVLIAAGAVIAGAVIVIRQRASSRVE